MAVGGEGRAIAMSATVVDVAVADVVYVADVADVVVALAVAAAVALHVADLALVHVLGPRPGLKPAELEPEWVVHSPWSAMPARQMRPHLAERSLQPGMG